MLAIAACAEAQSVTSLLVTKVVPTPNIKKSYAEVYTCLSDTLTIGYLLVPKEDEPSMALFNKCVSEDHWGRAVGISPKKYVPDLDDVQQAETLLAKLFQDGIIPRMRRWTRTIGDTANYMKYQRTYGFYYNTEGERCVYIRMNIDPLPGHVDFFHDWDMCDDVVFINLNMEKREVIRAYPSTCQTY